MFAKSKSLMYINFYWSGDGGVPWYVVRRQWCEARTVRHGAPEGCSLFRAANGRDPAEAASEPKHVQHTPQYHIHGYRKAQKTNTNPFPQKLDAARRCDANPREESRVRIADLNVLYRHQ